MTELVISRDLRLPIDFATKTVAILAQRRKGKTYTASVIAEEMVACRQPFVALDPTGAWWGLRASADGQRDGLPVVILGGQHADLPLERTGGRLVADLVVEEPGYYVIDFSLFESGEAERQFAVDFAERLYRAKGQPGRDFPLHLFIDEADRFVPQQLRKGSNETSARLLGAFEAIVRRGGLRGLGTTLISQRPAVVNKNVLEMIDVLIALRTVGPNDRKAVDEYVKAHGSDEERRDLLGSLASLAIGEAWIWEPGAEPPLFQRIRVRARNTFNSSATPKPGEKRRAEPKRLAPVDLEKYRSRMAATIERAQADDPKALRAKIREQDFLISRLNREAETRRDAAPSVSDEQIEAISERARADAQREADRAVDEIRGEVREVAQAVRLAADALTPIMARLDELLEEAPIVVQAPRVARPNGPAPSRTVSPRRSPAPARAAHVAQDTEIGGGCLRMLVALASRAPAGFSEPQWATLSKLKRTGGTWSTYKSRLRTTGYVEQIGDLWYATEVGIAAAGELPPVAESPDEILEMWKSNLGGGPARMLEALAAAEPAGLTRDELAEQVDITRSGGTFGTYLSRLRSNGLIDQPGETIRLSDVLR